jgi:hypothetical protein
VDEIKNGNYYALSDCLGRREWLILGSMVQEIIVAIVFAGAVFYVGQLIYKSLQSKSACTTGCGKCGALDIQKIEAQINEKRL